ncbi:transcription antitermination factor NusB [bacterium]|nr:transcription antitermination factor NusB [bacterium]NBX71931.1 transcription antitermination factor NusB [bacterium]
MQTNSDSQNIQKYKKRHNARLLAVQCLYSWQVSHTPLAEAKSTVLLLPEMANIDFDDEFFTYLTQTVTVEKNNLDLALAPFIKLGVDSLHPIERAIAWIAVVELKNQPLSVAPSIIINEAVDLTKELSDANAHKFMNAVLDSFSKALQ